MLQDFLREIEDGFIMQSFEYYIPPARKNKKLETSLQGKQSSEKVFYFIFLLTMNGKCKLL